jgi:glyoxylase-like metal-dependent hydrolase (beta-lactamase superfamily II)
MPPTNAIEIWPLVVSEFALDGGAMFGVIPRPMWERAAPPDSLGRISMVTRSLVVRISDTNRVVVIDSGMGQNWSDIERSRYRVAKEVPSIAESLEEIGIERDQVTDAIITHLHFDHAGGWTESDSNGKLVPVFPNATHYVQEEQLNTALEPSARDRGSFIEGNFKSLAEAGLIKTVAGSCELPCGVDVIALRGHTPGLQVPIVRGEKETVVFPSDLIPTAAHLKLPWIMAYDLYPLKTLEEKADLLEKAANNDWTLVIQHDPEITAVKITKHGDKFETHPCECPGIL